MASLGQQQPPNSLEPLTADVCTDGATPTALHIPRPLNFMEEMLASTLGHPAAIAVLVASPRGYYHTLLTSLTCSWELCATDIAVLEEQKRK